VRLYYSYSPDVANFIAKHNTARVLVLWSLLPMVGVSWMALHCGVSVTLVAVVAVIFLMGAGTVIFGRWIRLRHHALLT